MSPAPQHRHPTLGTPIPNAESRSENLTTELDKVKNVGPPCQWNDLQVVDKLALSAPLLLLSVWPSSCVGTCCWNHVATLPQSLLLATEVNLTKDEAIVQATDSFCLLPVSAGAGYFSFMAPLLNVLRWSTHVTAVPFCCCCFPQETASVALHTPHGDNVEATLGLDLCCHPNRTPNTYKQGEQFSGAIRQLIAAARGFILSPAQSWTKQRCCGASSLSVGAAGDATAVSSLALCCSRAEEAEGVFVQVRRVCALWLVWLAPFAPQPPSPHPSPALAGR